MAAAVSLPAPHYSVAGNIDAPPTPAQWCQMHRNLSARDGEWRLMLAVLEDGINKFISDRGGKGPNEATAWLFDDGDPRAPFGFVNTCLALGIDPDYLRAGLLKAKAGPQRFHLFKTPARHGYEGHLGITTP